MSIMDNIRQRQTEAVMPLSSTPPRHQPEMLYIGCVDARLDPVDDIGIDQGLALIFRNIGALVLKNESASAPLDPQQVLKSGVIPPNVNIGAMLEFFLNHIKLPEGKVKHIVVSGHTDCGGLRASHYHEDFGGDQFLPLYLDTLRDVRDRVREEAKSQNWNDAQLLHAFEEESVRQSMRNLMTYPCRGAHAAREEAGAAWLGYQHGDQAITEMNPANGVFEPDVGALRQCRAFCLTLRRTAISGAFTCATKLFASEW